MTRVWRKGCLCGCLIEEECRYYEPPAQRVEHVEYVDAEVEVIRELPAGQTFDEETP